MINPSIEVFGRIKPALANSQIKDFIVEEEINQDILKFSNEKYPSGRRHFRFKKVFRPDNSTQEDIFEAAAKPIIENVLTGYNGTIFAYGQTGTGKTYTMNGDFAVYNERGIIPRTIQLLFHSIKETSTVTISYFEIYNEHGYDLIGFQPATNTVELQQVNVLEDSRGNLHFRNLSAHNVRSVQEALDLLLFGDGNRMVAETMNNLRSSRSHTIFLITLETLDPKSENSIRSTLHLVDLAGSERLGKAKNLLNNSWETRYINLSLHYLEQVLVALGEPGRIHIPYRNSLMTTVLKNSLGGNCCTSMIATFSCEAKDFEETLQTCRFSQRVALVKNEAKVNEIMDINKEVMMLRKENAILKDQIRELQLKQSSEEKLNLELREKDKNDCYKRVRDFIADSSFKNLPLTNSKKAEYCFILMRNEILKLKPSLESQDECNSLTYTAGISLRNKEKKSENKTLFDAVGMQKENFIGRKNDGVIRKRRVVMDIPKINVIYKKYKSTETMVPEVVTDEPMEENKLICDEKENGKREKSIGNDLTKISELVQTTSSLMRNIGKRGNSIQPEMQSSFNNGKNLSEMENGKNEFKNFLLLNEKFKSGIGDEEKRNLSGNSEELVSEEDDFPGSGLVESPESDESSRFSERNLPLTGDAEVDEEIVKFYKARYKKLKRNIQKM